MFPKEFAFCLFINYARVWKKQFSGVPSRGLKRENSVQAKNVYRQSDQLECKETLAVIHIYISACLKFWLGILFRPPDALTHSFERTPRTSK